MKIVAVASSFASPALSLMAAEALRKTAEVMGHPIRVESQGSGGAAEPLSDAEIAAADVVILATDTRMDVARFAGMPVHETHVADAIRHTRAVLEAALALVPAPPPRRPRPPIAVPDQAPSSVEAAATAAPSAPAGKRIVGITACPTGIAHTFMAAEALQKAARAMGHDIKVETQGSVGAKNQLTADDIAAADAVVIAADTKVDTSRFAGKPVYVTSTKQAIKAGQEVIGTALAQPAGAASGPTPAATAGGAAPGRRREVPQRSVQAPDDRRVVHAAGGDRGRAVHRAGVRAGRHLRRGARGHAGLGAEPGGRRTAFRLFVAVFSRLHRLLHRRPAGARAGAGGRACWRRSWAPASWAASPPASWPAT